MGTFAALLDSIVAHGIPERSHAEQALRATVSVLGERLADEEAAALGKALPAELAQMLDQSEYDGDFATSEFHERVRRRIQASAGRAREAVAIVLRALGAQLGEESRGRLLRAISADLGRHLVPDELGEPPPHPSGHPHPSLTTLAAGRPESRHPLSESSPPAGHAHSVATNDDPHADTKLSSARGLTQERHDESLAAGRPPGPAHLVAETSD